MFFSVGTHKKRIYLTAAVALIFIVLSNTVSAQKCPDDFISPSFNLEKQTPLGQSLKVAYTGNLVTVGQQVFYYSIDTPSFSLRRVNLATGFEKQFSISALRYSVQGLMGISFLDSSHILVINANERKVLVYSLEDETVTRVLDFNKVLKPKERLYVHPAARLQKVGKYLVVPTVFIRFDYELRSVREQLYKNAPFILYDLEKNQALRPAEGQYWPMKYRQENCFPDFLPSISHNAENKIYLTFKYSDTLVSYNLDQKKIQRQALNLGANFPLSGMAEEGIASDRKFRIEQAQIGNYLYLPAKGKHIIVLKPVAPFIENERINSWWTINWHLLILNKNLEIEEKYCLNPQKDAEWHQMGFTASHVWLPASTIKAAMQQERRVFKALEIK
jgi:hypothetical protein